MKKLISIFLTLIFVLSAMGSIALADIGEPAFDANSSKTDNFKIKPKEIPECSSITVHKFYDANVNQVQENDLDSSGKLFEPGISGWKFTITDNLGNSVDVLSGSDGSYTIDGLLPGVYTIKEWIDNQTNWRATTDTTQIVTLGTGENKEVCFGNVCIGKLGGLTLGYWSNKNGAAVVTATLKTDKDDLVFLSGLNLCNALGTKPSLTTTKALNGFLLGANATNMAYMLSAQLTAMELNVRHTSISHVSGDTHLWIGDYSLPLGNFISLTDLMAAANDSLGLNPLTTKASDIRIYQEKLKRILDNVNNNGSLDGGNYVLPYDSTFLVPIWQ